MIMIGDKPQTICDIPTADKVAFPSKLLLKFSKVANFGSLFQLLSSQIDWYKSSVRGKVNFSRKSELK